MQMDSKIFSMQDKIKVIKKQIKNEKKVETPSNAIRKERAHKLIQLGVLFEMLELDTEDKEALLGYLKGFKTLTKDKKKEFKEEGHIFFNNRDKKPSKRTTRAINKVELQHLLEVFSKEKEDPFPVIQKKYKINLLEKLNHHQYLEILSELSQ